MVGLNISDLIDTKLDVIRENNMAIKKSYEKFSNKLKNDQIKDELKDELKDEDKYSHKKEISKLSKKDLIQKQKYGSDYLISGYLDPKYTSFPKPDQVITQMSDTMKGLKNNAVSKSLPKPYNYI
jgi:hypothetical protein